jgi:hypothetical protein
VSQIDLQEVVRDIVTTIRSIWKLSEGEIQRIAEHDIIPCVQRDPTFGVCTFEAPFLLSSVVKMRPDLIATQIAEAVSELIPARSYELRAEAGYLNLHDTAMKLLMPPSLAPRIFVVPPRSSLESLTERFRFASLVLVYHYNATLCGLNTRFFAGAEELQVTDPEAVFSYFLNATFSGVVSWAQQEARALLESQKSGGLLWTTSKHLAIRCQRSAGDTEHTPYGRLWLRSPPDSWFSPSDIETSLRRALDRRELTMAAAWYGARSLKSDELDSSVPGLQEYENIWWGKQALSHRITDLLSKTPLSGETSFVNVEASERLMRDLQGYLLARYESLATGAIFPLLEHERSLLQSATAYLNSPALRIRWERFGITAPEQDILMRVRDFWKSP